MTLSGKLAPTNISLGLQWSMWGWAGAALDFERDLFSIVVGIRPNCHNYQIRSLLGKKRIANFDHFLKNPLCKAI
jgi:hypothetical protein